MKSKVLIGLFVICTLSTCLFGQAVGQDAYPNKPINIIVPATAGGGIDLTARLIAMFLSEAWQVPVNVVNKPGGNRVIGTRDALTAASDGYTMLCDGHATAGMMEAMFPVGLPFDWRNRTWIVRQTTDRALYLTRMDAPWKNLKELAEYIKKSPKPLRWGESGIGLAAGAQFFLANNLSVKLASHVNFVGSQQTLAALAGNHIDFAIQQQPESIAFVQGKKVRAMAAINPTRLPAFPDVPSVVEEGYPMLDIFGWHGISGPEKLPEHIVTKWVDTLRGATTNPKFLGFAAAMYKQVDFLGPKELRAFVEDEYNK
jgi:tripartite-type tricarboxylate transporter receptor subunit TctC